MRLPNAFATPATLLALSLWLSGCGGGVEVKAVSPDAGRDVAAPDSLFSAILTEHVADGLVDYAALRNDTRFDDYIGHIARTNPDTLAPGAARLAFWINAYNAWTLKVICDNYPVESIVELHFGGRIVGHLTNRTVWDRDLAIVGGETMSLDDIEHGVIRKRFDDPRIHFALVCAARSCPPLRPEAFSGENLDEQLDDQGRRFLSRPEWNRFDVDTRTAYLSKIFDWYEGDFGRGRVELLRAIAPYAPPGARSSLEADPGRWRVEYNDYDWRLNSR